MDIRDNIRFQLTQAREMTTSVLNSLKSRDEWLFQPHEKANNPIWIATHLAMADNFMLSQLRPDQSQPLDEKWNSRYWFGSSPSSIDDENIATEEALTYMQDRRSALLAALDGMSDEEMAEPLPADSPFARFPNKLHIFLFNAQHEGIHFGQLTVAHRGLGNAPLYQPQRAE